MTIKKKSTIIKMEEMNIKKRDIYIYYLYKIESSCY